MKPETQSILLLTETPYDNYNAILPIIKLKLGNRTSVFETTLAEELPFTTARRAYRTAIMVACGEPKVYRETEHQKQQERKSKQNGEGAKRTETQQRS